MPPNLLYVGTYTETIHTLRLDPDSGELTEIEATLGVANPSYLALPPTNDCLYAVNEMREYGGEFGGAVSAYRVDSRNGCLALLNTQRTRGADPCHLRVDPSGRFIVVANYTSGHLTVLPIRVDGSLSPASQLIAHEGASVNPTRQTSPHPHHISIDPSGRRVFVADLGLDQILAYRFDPLTGMLQREGEPTRATPGVGPRQVILHPAMPLAYVLNELASTITIHSLDAETGHLAARESVSTVPLGFVGENSGAELQISPSGRFLYASNRGHDSIAVFAIDIRTGDLASRGHTPTMGATPRQFEISPGGEFLAAANQDGGNVMMFQIDPDSGGLEPTGHSVAISRPVCVKFTPVARGARGS
jgi:6-phosphogluconolactonase